MIAKRTVCEQLALGFVSLILGACNMEAPVITEKLLVVANQGGHSVNILDRTSGLELASVVTGVGPHEVTAHGPSALAVVANFGHRENPGSTLTVIDLVEKRAVGTVDLETFRSPHGIQFFQDGRRVVVVVQGSRAVLVVDVVSKSIQKVIKTNQRGGHSVLLSPDERYAFVSNLSSGTVSVVDLKSAALMKNIDTGRGAQGMALSPDGRELWVANREADSVSVIDASEFVLLETIPCESFPVDVAFLPDGKRVLVSKARSGAVAVFSAAKRKVIELISMELTHEENKKLRFELNPVPIGIKIDPAGEFAYVANVNADLITVLDLHRFAIVERMHAGDQPDGMAAVDISYRLP